MIQFDGPLQFVHADISDIRSFARSAIGPKYCLLMVDLFTFKINTYLKKNWSVLTKKTIVKGLKEKRDIEQTLRIQTDSEFNQNEIKTKINQKYKMDMCSASIHGGKAFAAEEKSGEFKKILFRTKTLQK